MGALHRLAGWALPLVLDRRYTPGSEAGRLGDGADGYVFPVCRWGYRPLLWRLRNRLIVTYLFIGVMPILLLLLMGGIAGYLFAGQFATYVAFSDLHSELQHLQAAN